MNILPIVEVRTKSGFAIAELAGMNVRSLQVRVAHDYVHQHTSPQLSQFDLGHYLTGLLRSDPREREEAQTFPLKDYFYYPSLCGQ
jgi:hypothetical protein